MYRKFVLVACSILLIWSAIKAQDIDSQLTEIKFLMMDGNYEEGLKSCKSIIESNAGDSAQLAFVYSYAGISSEALGNTEDAINYYRKAVELEVPQLDIYDKLISLSKKEKNDSVYEFALLEKLKAFPDFDDPLTKSLANHYANTSQYEKLLNTVNKLLEMYPDEIGYLFFKGVALQNLDQIEEAKVYYNKVLVADPNHSGANMGIGMMLYNDGTEIFAFRKEEYESKTNPDRVDYSIYTKGIEEGKAIYRKALPYLLKAYESGSYPGLKQVLFNTYIRLEQKEKAMPYRQ
ncbi:MAG: hypothetical protein K0B11_04110 [Mariniphaga sp.]|nr:hypothetical protein [Mariniphaga sp.]